MFKLLIVDDEEIEREGMANCISWEEYGIELAGTAWNGAEGLEKIKKLHPDIVLTDIKMPSMNGIELIRQTKKKYPNVEFIVLSGYGEYEFTSQAMEEGVRHYLLKPCDEEQISKVLDKVKKEISVRQGIMKKLNMTESGLDASALYYGTFHDSPESIFKILDLEHIRETADFGEIIFEIYLFFMKMDLENYTFEQKERTAKSALKFLYGRETEFLYKHISEKERTWELLKQTAEKIAQKKNISWENKKEGERVRTMLLAIFQYIGCQELSISFLAREVLYINEDYCGRVFARDRKIKFSAYLPEQRIKLAQRLLQYDPEMKISEVAQLVGYAPDGQYFSKAFRKIAKMSPTKYRELLNAGRNN